MSASVDTSNWFSSLLHILVKDTSEVSTDDRFNSLETLWRLENSLNHFGVLCEFCWVVDFVSPVLELIVDGTKSVDEAEYGVIVSLVICASDTGWNDFKILELVVLWVSWIEPSLSRKATFEVEKNKSKLGGFSGGVNNGNSLVTLEEDSAILKCVEFICYTLV